jgi:hypothetical protein
MKKKVSKIEKIAKWIVRYKDLGVLYQDGFSPLLCELLENGSLVKFEPSLEGYKGRQELADDDYDEYGFTVRLEISDLLHLYFSFNNNDVCTVALFDFKDIYASCVLSEEEGNTLSAIGLPNLNLSNFFKDLSWKEADKVILKYAGK